jgi:hypothetical protein
VKTYMWTLFSHVASFPPKMKSGTLTVGVYELALSFGNYF